MIKYHNFDVVFAEVPDETTLAINLTNCPNRCKGCHSQHLLRDTGTPLDEAELERILERYAPLVTCLCFMGGDAAPLEVEHLARHARTKYPHLKTAWYSGREQLAEGVRVQSYDYVKLGPWREACGPLNSPSTNQRMYSISADGTMEDITSRFWKKKI